MSNTLKPIENMPEVSFIENITLDELLTEMINDYEKKYEEIKREKISLSKADPYRIILNACALQFYQALQNIDKGGKMNLLKYSHNNYLDNLASLRGITRNSAKAAIVTMKFILEEPMQFSIGIPEGTRVTADGLYFATLEYDEIPAGEIEKNIVMQCTQDGKVGNGYLPGQIKSLADSIPYIKEVKNITESEGGEIIESDENLAERVYLSPSGYSVAGPVEAYKYWAKTFNQGITDIKVSTFNPGEVDIRFVLEDGKLPTETMAQELKRFLDDSNKKPLTDKVFVGIPEIEEYEIEVEYWINLSDNNRAISIQDNIVSVIDNFILWQDSKIGRDINPSELISLVMSAGAKRVNVIKPQYKIINNIAIAKIVNNATIINKGIEDD